MVNLKIVAHFPTDCALIAGAVNDLVVLLPRYEITPLSFFIRGSELVETALFLYRFLLLANYLRAVFGVASVS